MNCLLLRYVAKNVNCNIVAKSIYFFSLSNWIFFTHNVFMFDFFFYFKAWKIDWEFVGTCFLDSLSHRKFFFIFRLSANCQGARIWLWEVWMCSIQWIWSGIFLCCHALCQRCVSPSGHRIEKRRKTKTTQVNYIFTPIQESSSWEHEFWIV